MAGISLKPSEYVEGGGLLDDVNGTLQNCRFASWDYNGKVAQPVPALAVDIEVDGEIHTQYFSMGKAKDFAPSKDGKSLQAIGTATTLNRGSNGAIFLTSLINAGFPEDKLDDDISVLDGTEVHLQRQPAPKRSGAAPREDGREATILVVSEIQKLPWDKKATTKSAAKKETKTAAKSAPKAEAASDVEEETQGVILEILAENPDGVTKQQLPAKIFQKVAKDNPNKNAIVQTAFKDDFLGGSDRPWSYADGKLTM